MALVKGVNSYVLLAEANNYFENRLDAIFGGQLKVLISLW